MPKLTDEYFLNLVMPVLMKDNEIYKKWAAWCAASNNRYCIKSKDDYFYTYVKSDEEIEIENKRNELSTFISLQNYEHKVTAKYKEYQKWFFDNMMDDEHILEFIPLTYEEWKNK